MKIDWKVLVLGICLGIGLILVIALLTGWGGYGMMGYQPGWVMGTWMMGPWMMMGGGLFWLLLIVVAVVVVIVLSRRK